MNFSKSLPVWKSYFENSLKELKEKNLYRFLRPFSLPNLPVFSLHGKRVVNLSSNNYLNLAGSRLLKELLKKGIELYGAGSGASRLICGTFEVHMEAEKSLSDFKMKEKALIFGSGYLANISLLSSLGDEKTDIFSDQLNHASIVDGCRMARGSVHIYRHRDVNHLEDLLKRSRKKRLIVTDGVFSMDGDVAPIKELVELSKLYDALLIVDDAHGTGVLGKEGRGSTFSFEEGKEVHIVMGTLGKAFGLFGAFVATSEEVWKFLINRARPFIYTTAVPPSIAYAAKELVPHIMKMDKERKELHRKAEFVRKEIKNIGLSTLDSRTQIIPVIIGDEGKTMKLSKFLFERGYLAHGIRPPTVPEGSSRIRISISAGHSMEDLKGFLSALKEGAEKLGII